MLLDQLVFSCSHKVTLDYKYDNNSVSLDFERLSKRGKETKNIKHILNDLTFNFGHKCTTNESNANHLKSIFNKNLSFRACLVYMLH